MASVRKTIKAAKRKYREIEKEIPSNILKVTAYRFVVAWNKAALDSSYRHIRMIAHMKAFTRRKERKIKKQGRWTEYCEFKAYMRQNHKSLIVNIDL